MSDSSARIRGVCVSQSWVQRRMLEEMDAPPEQTGELLTVGHGTASQDAFGALLRWAEIAAVVDVRIGPGSRRSPHFGRSELERWLPARGIDYRWEQRLGGFRRLVADSPDAALRNESFRAYAAHMRTPDFEEAMAGLVAQARRQRTAVMCSESVWWRCHRRLIADHAELLDGLAVMHLMPDSRESRHRPTEGARVSGSTLVYDDGEGHPSE